jgi:hypothetical protein
VDLELHQCTIGASPPFEGEALGRRNAAQGTEPGTEEQESCPKRDAYLVRVGDALGTYGVQPKSNESVKAQRSHKAREATALFIG